MIVGELDLSRESRELDKACSEKTIFTLESTEDSLYSTNSQTAMPRQHV